VGLERSPPFEPCQATVAAQPNCRVSSAARDAGVEAPNRNRTSDGGPMTRTRGGTMKSTRRPARPGRLGLAIGAASAAVLLLAACGSSSSDSSGASSGGGTSGALSKAASNPSATLIVNNAVPIATLDPNLTTNDQDPAFNGAMNSTLT